MHRQNSVNTRRAQPSAEGHTSTQHMCRRGEARPLFLYIETEELGQGLPPPARSELHNRSPPAPGLTVAAVKHSRPSVPDKQQ